MLTSAPLMLGLELAPWMIGILVVFFVVVSVILMLTILIQKPQGGGLSAAFGAGAGSGQTAFGTKTGDALTIATISMFAIWVLFAIGLNFALTPVTVGKQQPAMTAEQPAPSDSGAPASTTEPATSPAGTDQIPTGTPESPAPAPAEQPQPAPGQPTDPQPGEPAAEPGEKPDGQP